MSNLNKTILEQESYADSKQNSNLDATFNSFENFDQNLLINKFKLFSDQILSIELAEPELNRNSILEIMRSNDLEFTDSGFEEKLLSQDCWEIMDFNSNQLYRNKTCYDLSDYTTEQYDSYSPFELFERPAFIFEILVQGIGKLHESNQMIPLDFVPDYIMQEMLTEKQRKFKIRHKYACAIQDRQTKTKLAFVSVFRATPIEEDNVKVLSSKLLKNQN